MTTIGAAVDETLNEWLLSSYRPMFNVLQTPMAADATILDAQLSFDLMGVGQGGMLSIDSELMYVVAANANAKRVTVVRAVRGTTLQDHVAGAAVEMNPRYPRSSIISAMRKEIQSWPLGMYRMDREFLGAPTGAWSVDVAGTLGVTDITRIFGVKRQDPAHSDHWVDVVRWRPDIRADSDGAAIVRFASPLPADTQLRITIGRKYDLSAFDETIDFTADIGIPDGAVEVVELGAAWRLIGGKETKRLMTDAQPESRRAEEVPVQSNATWAQQLKKLRDMRLSEEMDKLVDSVGLRMEG